MQTIEIPLQIVCESAHQLYVQVLEAILGCKEVPSVRDPKSIGSAWGTRDRPTKELRYVTLVLENSRNRLINSPTFQLEEAFPRTMISTLSDEFEAQSLAFYNPKVLEFSDNRKTLPSNYGYRMRHLNGIDQIQEVVDQLTQDPYSRRAVIHIHAPGDSTKKYVPCINSLHFLIRDGQLECQSFWRSENALTLLPMNIFEFTMLQELIASELGIPAGRYVHCVTSLHYYLDDEERLIKTLDTLQNRQAPDAMEQMSPSSLAQISILRQFEQVLRLNLADGVDQFFDLSHYWQQIATVIGYAIAKKKGDPAKMVSWIKSSQWRNLILR